eukprot:s1122_g2.t1
MELVPPHAGALSFFSPEVHAQWPRWPRQPVSRPDAGRSLRGSAPCTSRIGAAGAVALSGAFLRAKLRRSWSLAIRRVRKAKIVQMDDDFDDLVEEEEDQDDALDYEDDENYEGPWQHALSLLQAMQARRLQLGEINVGSAVQACLAVRTSKSPMSSRWQQALMLFRTKISCPVSENRRPWTMKSW